MYVYMYKSICHLQTTNIVDLITCLFLQHVEIVNNNTNEEIECEKGAEDDEDHKIYISPHVCFSLWLFVHLQW